MEFHDVAMKSPYHKQLLYHTYQESNSSDKNKVDDIIDVPILIRIISNFQAIITYSSRIIARAGETA